MFHCKPSLSSAHFFFLCVVFTISPKNNHITKKKNAVSLYVENTVPNQIQIGTSVCFCVRHSLAQYCWNGTHLIPLLFDFVCFCFYFSFCRCFRPLLLFHASWVNGVVLHFLKSSSKSIVSYPDFWLAFDWPL